MQVAKLIRKWVYFSHLWIGLTFGLYFSLLGLSGSILVLKPELSNFFDTGARQVAPPPVDTQIDVDRVVQAFKKTHDGEKITTIVLPEQATDAMSVLYKTSGKANSGRRSESRQVFFNPYTGQFLADEISGGEFYHFVKDLHTKLLLDDLGTELHRYGVLLIVVLLASGIWMWWPSTRDLWKNRGSRFFQHLSQRTTIKLDGTVRRFAFDTHNAVGFYSSLLLLLFAFTAITFLWRDQSINVIAALTQSQIKAEKKNKSPSRANQDEIVSYNLLLAGAKKALPGLKPLQIGSDGKVMMAEADSHFVSPRLIAVLTNVQSGAVEKIERPDSRSIGQQVLNWAMPVHFGQWGPGIAYMAIKCLWFMTGLCPLTLCVTGYLMYLAKGKAKKKVQAAKGADESADKSVDVSAH